MCRNYLLVIYEAFYARTHIRSAYIEQQISIQKNFPITPDEKRNIPTEYAMLFSNECRIEVEKLYMLAMREMYGCQYDDSKDVINGLIFLQELVATALWKHNCIVGDVLEAFAREFDRLDLSSEQKRLYLSAQKLFECS